MEKYEKMTPIPPLNASFNLLVSEIYRVKYTLSCFNNTNNQRRMLLCMFYNWVGRE